jgi:hypothetical protein
MRFDRRAVEEILLSRIGADMHAGLFRVRGDDRMIAL